MPYPTSAEPAFRRFGPKLSGVSQKPPLEWYSWTMPLGEAPP